jgi:hypothetical protein
LTILAANSSQSGRRPQKFNFKHDLPQENTVILSNTERDTNKRKLLQAILHVNVVKEPISTSAMNLSSQSTTHAKYQANKLPLTAQLKKPVNHKICKPSFLLMCVCRETKDASHIEHSADARSDGCQNTFKHLYPATFWDEVTEDNSKAG